MPMSLDFGGAVAVFQDRFALQFSTIQRAFDRIGDWLDTRLDAARELDRASQAFPIVDFFSGAVTAAVDRVQFGALASRPAPGFGAEMAAGGRQFVSGLEGIPRGVQAGLAIPGALRALADLFERISNSLFKARPGGTLNDLMLRLAAMTNRSGVPAGPGIFDALLKFAPRMAPAVATILHSLAQFTRQAGTGTGPGQLGTFADGLGAVRQAWREAFPSSSASGGDPLAQLRDATRVVAAALAALPWLGVYLPIVWQMGALAFRLGLLGALESIESQIWDLRASILKRFFVDLELYRRAAIVWLGAAQRVLVGQLKYYTAFAASYLEEFGIGVRRLATDVQDVMQKIDSVFNSLRIALQVLAYFDWLSAIAPGLPFASPFTLANLAEMLIEGNAAMAAKLRALLDLVEPVATPQQKILIDILRQATRLPRFLSALPPEPVAPTITPLPKNLIDQFFGPGGGDFARLLGSMRDTIQSAVKTILSTSVTGLVAAADLFTHLRDRAAALDLSERFADVLSNGEARVDQLMQPHQKWLKEHEQPTGLEGIAGAFEDALATAGFDVVGAAVPAYIGTLRDLWAPEVAAATEKPTSPHIIARRARLRAVRLHRLTIRALGQALDEPFGKDIAARAQAAVAEAYQRGTLMLAPSAGPA